MQDHDTCTCEAIETPLRIGDTLPELSFPAYLPEKNTIETISTANYADTWKIFFFYPADFTFICPTELQEMAKHYDEFQKEGAEVFSFSTDTAFAHKAWHDSSPAIKEIRFPMAADPSGDISRLFGTYIEEGDDAGLSLRGSFIVGPDSVVKSILINGNSIGRSAAELLRTLRAAKFVHEHGGLVCPASWEPGDETLKPGVNLVEKI